MQSVAVCVGEIVTLVVRHQVDHSPFRQGRRLVEQ
jgi:hypothetical protein